MSQVDNKIEETAGDTNLGISSQQNLGIVRSPGEGSPPSAFEAEPHQPRNLIGYADWLKMVRAQEEELAASTQNASDLTPVEMEEPTE